MGVYVLKEDDGSILGIFESSQEINHEFLEQYVRNLVLTQVMDEEGSEDYLNKCNFYNLTCKDSLIRGLSNLFPACKKLSEFDNYEDYKIAWNKHMNLKGQFESRISKLNIDYLQQMINEGILKPVVNEFKEICV